MNHEIVNGLDNHRERKGETVLNHPLNDLSGTINKIHTNSVAGHPKAIAEQTRSYATVIIS